jgi:hypothetical protein
LQLEKPMNRILYCLIGCGVAGAIMAAFFQKKYLAKITSTDFGMALLFVALLAGAAWLMLYSPWGRRLKVRSDKKFMEQDDRARHDARTKGKVRTDHWLP